MKPTKIALYLSFVLAASTSSVVMAESITEAITSGKTSADLNLRYESVSQDNALKDADAIIISRVDQVSEEKLNGLQRLIGKYHRADVPIGKISYKPNMIVDSFDQEVMKVEDLKGKRVIAVTAIAAPESFYNMLESFGAEIVKKRVYPDHYFFNHEDINDILIESSKHDAIVMTSEKDMVKLRKVSKDSRICSLNIEVNLNSKFI